MKPEKMPFQGSKESYERNTQNRTTKILMFLSLVLDWIQHYKIIQPNSKMWLIRKKIKETSPLKYVVTLLQWYIYIYTTSKLIVVFLSLQGTKSNDLQEKEMQKAFGDAKGYTLNGCYYHGGKVWDTYCYMYLRCSITIKYFLYLACG